MPSSADPAASRRPAKGAKAATSAATAAPTTKRSRARRTSGDGQVRLTGDRLVVRSPDNGERTSTGGLLIPATAMPAPKRLMWAEVVLAGPDVRAAKLGDHVLFLPQSGLEVDLEGEDLLLLRERDIQAVRSPTIDGADRPPGQYL
jgi:chaperonin GroES